MGGGQRAEGRGGQWITGQSRVVEASDKGVGTLCSQQAAPLPWAILTTGSEILHPRRGMSASFGHL